MKLSIALIGFSLCSVIPLKAQESPVILNTQSAIECNEVPLEIRSFKDTLESEKFKIVANRPLTYSAIGGLSHIPYNWILSKSNTTPEFNYFFTLQGITPSLMSNAGTARIDPNTLGQFNSNQYFGPAFLSVLNGGSSDSCQAEIFFEKEESYFMNGNPNWFEYWRDNAIIKALLESVPIIKEFDLSTCNFVEKEGYNPIDIAYAPGYEYTETYLPDSSIFFGNYGSIKSDPYIIPVGPGTSFCQNSFKSRKIVGHQGVVFSIKLGPGASRKKIAWNRNNILEGIHVYYSTLVHEVEHARIFYDNWKDGYDRSKDGDDDNYHDGWEAIANSEMNESSFYPKPYGRFEIEIDDKYHKYDPDSLFQNPPKVSAGTDYEEWRCLKKEYDLFSQLYEIDEYDWSYDPPVEIYEDPRLRTQGKQWKN